VKPGGIIHMKNIAYRIMTATTKPPMIPIAAKPLFISLEMGSGTTAIYHVKMSISYHCGN
jgi:hypothetical protein